MAEKKIVKLHSFPDYLAPDEEKATKEYGLAMGKAIEYEWFFRPESGTGTCTYYDKRQKYHTLRLYARGEQDTAIYKNLINNGEESSYTNYDWRPLQIIPKFVKLITNQMAERMYEVSAEAVDKYSTDLKDKHRTFLEDLMVSKPLIEDAKAAFGVDLMPPNIQEIPESQEEIDLHMQLKYKPAIEIATEEAIKYTLNSNDFDEIQNQILEDITTIGIGAVKHRTDPTKGILVERVDVADMVYSYPVHRDFKNVHYYGEVERMTIAELKRRSGDAFTKDQLTEFGKRASDWNAYHRTSNQFSYSYVDENLDGIMVDVLNFTFKSLNTLTYKKKFDKNGGFRLIKRESTFTKKTDKYDGYDVVKKDIDVWYEGSLVLGTEYVFNYKLCENMVRPKGLISETIPNYIIYAPELYQNRTRSLVESIIPLVDQMQQIHIKLQQLIAKARPNGIYIDVNGIEEVPLGDGSFLTPLELIKIYDETGNVLGTSVTHEGEYNYGREPIKELKNGIVDGLDRLIGAYNHYLNLLRDTIGVGAGADASMPHPDTPVAIQNQVSLNSNVATRHILNGCLSLTKRLARGLSLRLKDIFVYSDLKEAYINAIGRANVEILNSIKDYHLHDLGINIELKPDAQERQSLEGNINIALTKESITLDDAIDIRSIGNLKLANQVLKIRRAKREKDVKAFEMEKIKANAEAQAQAAERASQAKLMEFQAKAQSDIAVDAAKTENKIKELNFEKNAKAELMEKEFTYNMQLKGIEVEGKAGIEKTKEDNKLMRQDRANSQASKLIEQRTFNAPSQDFQSSEDTLSGSMNIDEIGVS